MLISIFISLLLLLLISIFIETHYLIKKFNKKKLRYNAIISIEKIKYFLNKKDYNKLTNYIEIFFQKNFDDLESLIIALDILISEYSKKLDKNDEEKNLLENIIKKLIKKGVKLNPANIALNELSIKYFNISNDPDFEKYLSNNYKSSNKIFYEYIKYLVEKNNIKKAIQIIKQNINNKYLVTANIEKWLSELEKDESYILQLLNENPNDLSIRKKYIINYLLPKKKYNELIKNIIDILYQQEEIDKDLLDILIKTLEENDFLNIKVDQEKLIAVFNKINKIIDNFKIKQIILKYLISTKNINNLNIFIKENKNYIYNNEDFFDYFLSILPDDKKILNLLEIDKIIEKINTNLYTNYNNIYKYIRFLKHALDIEILSNEYLISIKDIIDKNININTSNIDELMIYINLLLKTNNKIKAYEYLNEALINNMKEHIDLFIDVYKDILKEIMIKFEDKINYEKTAEILELALKNNTQDIELINIYISIIKHIKNKEEILNILNDYIYTKKIINKEIIESYISSLVENLNTDNFKNIRHVNEIYKLYNNFGSYNITYNKILYWIKLYQDNKINEIYTDIYNFLHETNISLNEILVIFFINIFKNTENIKENIKNEEINYIIKKILDNIQDINKKEEIILIKAKIIYTFEDLSKSINFISDYILSSKTKNAEIHKQYILLLHNLIKNNVSIESKNIPIYVDTLKISFNFISNDFKLVKYYLEFLFNIKEYSTIESYCEKVLENQVTINDELYRYVILLYLKISKYIIKNIQKDSITFKTKKDSILNKLTYIIKPFINQNSNDTEIIIECANVYQNLDLFNEALDILDKSTNYENEKDIINIFKTKLNIMNKIGISLEEQIKITKELLKKYNNNYELYIILAKLLYQTLDINNTKEADELIKKAYEIEKSNLEVLTLYINMMLKNNKTKEILPIVDDLVKKYPHNQQILSLYLDVYRQHELNKSKYN